MSEQTIKARVAELTKAVIEADKLYEENKPLLTDTEYDELYAELVRLEEEYPEYMDENSPTQRIVTSKVAGLKTVKHSEPMLSQDKTTTYEGIEKYLNRCVGESGNLTNFKGRLLVQQKLDGLTIVVHYKGGKYVQAVTRGNGIEGEDVTHTIATVESVPKSIDYKGDLELRGEAIISFKEFERINVDGHYSNTRNLASGTVRQLDAKVAKERKLDVIMFDVVKIEKDFEDDYKQLGYIKKLGFHVVPTKVFDFDGVKNGETLEGLKTYVGTYNEEVRPKLAYMIDGLVLKMADKKIREVLGSTSKFPRWAIAYKFKSLNARTKLQEIILQVGKTGQITPVAVFDKTTIDNVEIEKASLHNFSNIATKDIRIGDTILIERANDVIPQVLKSFHELRDGSEQEYKKPTKCPSCNGDLVHKGENLYCINDQCKPILVGKIKHFVSRDALDVDGLAVKTVEFLLDNGFIKGIGDLYRLNTHYDAMTAIKGFGVKKVDKMLKGLEESKKAPLHQVIYSLSIDLIGRSASKDIAKVYKNMDEILDDYSKGELGKKLTAIDGFGDLMVKSLLKYLSSPKNQGLITELQVSGFTMESEYFGNEQEKDTSLEGLVFVITGSLSRGRNDWKKEIEYKGGKVTGSVTKKTSYILTNDTESSSSKFVKGKELGIEFLTEDQFAVKFG